MLKEEMIKLVSGLSGAFLLYFGSVLLYAQPVTTAQVAVKAQPEATLISKETTVPLAILGVGVMMTGVLVWRASAEKNKITVEVTKLQTQLDAHTKSMRNEFREVKDDVTTLYEKVDGVNTRLGRVEGYISSIGD